MKTIFKAALTYLLVSVLSSAVIADEKTDQLLSKIDADISAKRLSSPAGNNAIDKIWQFLNPSHPTTSASTVACIKWVRFTWRWPISRLPLKNSPKLSYT